MFPPEQGKFGEKLCASVCEKLLEEIPILSSHNAGADSFCLYNPKKAPKKFSLYMLRVSKLYVYFYVYLQSFKEYRRKK